MLRGTVPVVDGITLCPPQAARRVDLAVRVLATARRERENTTEWVLKCLWPSVTVMIREVLAAGANRTEEKGPGGGSVLGRGPHRGVKVVLFFFFF